MKKHFTILLLLILISVSVTSEEEQNIILDSKTGFPSIQQKPFVIFNEGISFATVTRLQKQQERSNFVLNDKMIGAWFGIKTINMQPLNSIVRISTFYPFQSTFNKVPQISKQTILYAFDLFASPVFESSMWKYVKINIALPGLHFLYQLSDDWHYISLGVGSLLGLELPLASRWTIMINGIAALDYGNFGTNKIMMPFNYTWEYQIDLGIRYSRKEINKYSYIKATK